MARKEKAKRDSVTKTPAEQSPQSIQVGIKGTTILKGLRLRAVDEDGRSIVWYDEDGTVHVRNAPFRLEVHREFSSEEYKKLAKLQRIGARCVSHPAGRRPSPLKEKREEFARIQAKISGMQGSLNDRLTRAGGAAMKRQYYRLKAILEKSQRKL